MVTGLRAISLLDPVNSMNHSASEEILNNYCMYLHWGIPPPSKSSCSPSSVPSLLVLSPPLPLQKREDKVFGFASDSCSMDWEEAGERRMWSAVAFGIKFQECLEWEREKGRGMQTNPLLTPFLSSSQPPAIWLQSGARHCDN